MLETIENLWKSFEKHVVPNGAPDVQRTETRRAFYAGVAGMMGIVKRIGEPDIKEMAGVLHLEMLEQELLAFREGVLSGRF